MLTAKVSVIFVGKAPFNLRLLEILVAAHSVGTGVVGRVVVISALLLLLLLSSMLEIVALRVPAALVEAAFFLLKISSSIASVMPSLESTIEVATFVVVVSTFPVDNLVVRIATM